MAGVEFRWPIRRSTATDHTTQTMLHWSYDRRCGFLLTALVVSLKWTLVSLYPLGLEARGVGIHQRQPNYLPTYNGIFSIHALNFTSSSTADTPIAGHQSTFNGTEDQDRTADEDTKLYPVDGGTAANEVDSEEDRLKIPGELTTFPQLHVVTQTIGDDVTTGREDDVTTRDTHEDDVRGGDEEATATTQNETTDVVHTDSETLLQGSEEVLQEDEDSSEDESEDLFDRLMRTIQGHWLDFVSKMKMSVLDVWKSISHHMMERLESFATVV